MGKKSSLLNFAQTDSVLHNTSPYWKIDVSFFRGIAVLLVVLCHLGIPGFEFGFIGVDLFFVISGYVITSSMVREYEKAYSISRSRGGINLVNFAFRRARRILPVAFLGLIFTLAGSYLIMSEVSFSQAVHQVLWPAFFLANIYFSQQSNNYFAPPAEQSLFMHYWSLGVEEQFYIILPIFFTLLVGLHNLHLFRIRVPWKKRLVLGCSIVFATSLTAFIILFEQNITQAYYSLNYRIWELMWGVLCALVSHVIKFSYSSRLENTILALLPLIFWQTNSNRAVYPTVALVILIGLLFLNNSMRTSSLLKLYYFGPVLFLSRVSYSLYIFHWPVIIFCQNLLTSNLLIRVPVTIVFVLVISLLSHFFVEAPMLRKEIPQFTVTRHGNIKKQFGKAVSVLIIFGIFYVNDPRQISSLLSLNFLKPKVEKFDTSVISQGILAPEAKVELDAKVDSDLSGNDVPSQFTESSLRIAVNEALLNPPGLSSSTIEALTKGANLGILKGCNGRTCRFGSGESSILFVGDSHMTALGSTLLNIIDLKKYTVYTKLEQGCPFSKISILRSRGGPSNNDCVTSHESTLNFLKNTKIDILISTESFSYPLISADSTLTRYTGLKQAIQSYESSVEKILIFLPVPQYSNWSDCLDKNENSKNCKGYLNVGSHYFEAATQISKELSKVYLVDVITQLCNQGECPGVVDQIPVTADGNHLRQEFLTRMKLIIGDKIERLGISIVKF